MKSLQLWLAVLGGVVLAAIVAHGAWQARRAAGRRAALAPVEPAVGPTEPSFDAPTDPADVDGLPARPVAAVRRTVAGPRVDALIDAIAVLSLDAPVSAEQALAHLPVTRRAGSKPFLIEGLNAANGEWEPLTPGATYGEFQAGLQMANRHGALNEIEYSEFVQKVQAFADALGAQPDFPDMLDVVARARELDHFASQHDAQLAMRLHARGPAWTVGFMQQHASRHGFVPGVTPGRLVLPSPEEGAPPLLTLQFDVQAALAEEAHNAPVRELTLAFDVPQTAAAQQPFNAWCAAGEALALALDAFVSDDQGQPLFFAAFPTIGAELEDLYAQLAQRDLAAGSPAARRLFS